MTEEEGMKVGIAIHAANEHPAAMVVLAAFMNGWDGQDVAEDPEVDVTALAIRDLFEDPDLTREEVDRLVFRYAGFAEDWLNGNASLPGHKFGWHDGNFWFQTDQWWDDHGGPDRMWLP